MNAQTSTGYAGARAVRIAPDQGHAGASFRPVALPALAAAVAIDAAAMRAARAKLAARHAARIVHEDEPAL